MATERYIIYECGICSCYHPWHWSGDCREDYQRFQPEEFAARIGVYPWDLEIRTMEERVKADAKGEK